MIEATDLQHGLVRWVQNYGDHVLRTLIQRSPKLPHHSPRRHSSSSTSSSGGGTNGSGSRSRSKSDLTPKSQRYRTTPELLTPPFAPLRPPTAYQAPLMANHSPTHNFYGMGLPMVSPSPMPAPGLGGQQGPMQYIRFPALVPSSTGVPQPMGSAHPPPQPQAMVANTPQTGGMVYQPLPQQFGLQQPTALGLGSHGVATGFMVPGLPSTGGKEALLGGQEVGVGESPLSDGVGATSASEGSDNGSSNVAGMEIISKLMQVPQHHQTSAFHQVSTPQPLVAANTGHFLDHPHGGGGGNGGMISALQLEGSHHAHHPLTATVAGSLRECPQYPQLSTTSSPFLPHHLAQGTISLPPPHTAAAITGEHAEALLPIPRAVPSVTPLTALTPTMQPPVQLMNNRKEVICRYYIAGQGHCPYGEKCWFAHLEPNLTAHPREFVHAPQTTVPSTPLHIQVPPPQPHGWNPSMSVQYLASPPQSPLGGAYIAPADPSSVGVRTPILHSTPPYPFPGQPPILVWQPSPGRAPRNFPLLPSLRPQLPVPVPIDPTLRFGLLSEVVVMSEGPDGGPVQNISQLTTRADHFYVSFGNKVRDYKILFSGQRTHQESWTLHDTFSFTHRVTCLHSSRQHQFLLLVGTEAGLVYSCMLRRGNQYGQTSIISQICSVDVSFPSTKGSLL